MYTEVNKKKNRNVYVTVTLYLICGKNFSGKKRKMHLLTARCGN
jgi:hypothetical protein